MTDPRREHSGTVKPSDGPNKRPGESQRASRTEGTDRDFDEKGESQNQGHGHPREEREGEGEAR